MSTFEPATATALRHTLAGFATGLSIVAAEVDGRIVGMPVNSLSSVSLEPPMVSLAFAHSSTTWPLLRRAPRWGISILSETHADVLERARRPSPARFDGTEMVTDSGAAFLPDALAALVIAPSQFLDAGDHTIALLDVVSLHRDTHQRPLVFFDSTLHTLAPQRPSWTPEETVA